MNVPKLHIYSPAFWHEPAFIVGNREGLEHLKALIDFALQHGRADEEPLFTSDGEGFSLTVELRTDVDIDTLYRLPYTDDVTSSAFNDDKPLPH